MEEMKMMATAAEEIKEPPCHCPVVDTSPSLVFFTVRRKHNMKWKSRFIYLQCYFLTIATILGTGILGLPVTIAHSGLVPFLISFLIGFCVQALLIYLFVELLQKCQVVQLESLKKAASECIVLDQVNVQHATLTEDEDEDESDNAESDTGLLQPESVDLQNQEEDLQPNLHLLGQLFLSRPMSHAFNCILLFQFISIGTSYVLAGSEAFAALLNVRHIYIIPAFTWILTLAILLGHKFIQPVTSLLTLLKGILLIVTVAVTLAVGSEVGLESSSDFRHIGKPFLMGTVALGGIVNVMPLLFSQIEHNRTQIIWFRRAILCGLMTCTVLNILWCWAVLEIVPQTSSQQRHETLETTSQNLTGSLRGPQTSSKVMLYSNISLDESEKAGEIATIPLTKIISERYKSYAWVAQLIQVFIAISVSVSFLVMGSAMKHTIDGLVSSCFSKNIQWLSTALENNQMNRHQMCTARSTVKGLASLLAFVVIFIVSVFDPKGFVVILDKVVSFSLNTEVGLFIFIMLRESREDRYQHIGVPLPVGDCVFSLTWLLPTYFLFAVTFDALQSLADIVHFYLPFHSHDHVAHDP
ncbi:uncharacterized protein LOC103376826 [Cynoglossus semilaevis]|uniref:uncharacterized protein LOC103376826 n=1 Tax=Cynoglossus semilaevis TaxID=244447 RepID=UPI000D627EDF|nr:uncharacterized protein LOC103376826 [Cynoglossus semilaevis]